MYPYEVYRRLSAQEKKIKELEQKIDRLHGEMTAFQKDPKTVEYHFDQLKIDRLDGTLNIGLTPGGGSDLLEEFSVNGQDITPYGATPEMMENIRQKVFGYLNGEAWKDLKQIEQQVGYPLDDPYRRFIFQDLQKQIEPRIRHYIHALAGKQDGDIIQTVTEKVNADIYKGMKGFVEKLKQGENKS